MKFSTLVKHLEDLFGFDYQTDMELLYRAESRLCWFLDEGKGSPREREYLHDILRAVRSYTTQFTWHIPDIKSAVIQFQCRMLPMQLLKDFPPQEIDVEEVKAKMTDLSDTGFGTIVSFGGPGKTVWPPKPIEEELWLDKGDPEYKSWELN